METKTSANTIADACPAFADDGCPYKTLDDASKALAKKCPAFADGCPFKGASDVDTISQLLATVPESHRCDGKMMGSAKALYDLLLQMHEMSVVKKNEIGNECPVFSTSCPFKNVTSHGSPLVSELDYRTWSVFSPEELDPPVAIAAERSNVDLSKHLKAGTKKSHRAAENVQFVRSFIKGKIDQKIYKRMVISLWHTYTALEEELRRHKNHPTYSKLHFPRELERVAALEEDLAYYYGPSWRTLPEITAPPSPCTQDYIDRIKYVGDHDPDVLVAHAYTRYLGDLSGGQTLMRVAKKAMGLPEDGSGTAFYRFPELGSTANGFKKKYRALMDETPVDADLADRIVAEANLAFIHNMRTFEELDVLMGVRDQVRTLQEVLDTLEMPVKAGQKCPFAGMGGSAGKLFHGSAAPSKNRDESRDSGSAASAVEVAGKCPFPFVLLHDPMSVVQNPSALLRDRAFWMCALTVVFAVGASFIGIAQ